MRQVRVRETDQEDSYRKLISEKQFQEADFRKTVSGSRFQEAGFRKTVSGSRTRKVPAIEPYVYSSLCCSLDCLIVEEIKWQV